MILSIVSIVIVLISTYLLRHKFKGKNHGGIFLRNKKADKIKYARLLPFPFPVAIIDGLYNLFRLKKEGVKALEDMCKEYGYFYKAAIGPITTVVVADPSIAQKILCSSNPAHLNKPQAIYSRIFVDWFRKGLVNSEYETWSPHRKMLSRCFTYKSLLHNLKIMNTNAQSLTKNMISEIKNTEIGNFGVEADSVSDIIYRHAIKIIMQIVMGADQLSEAQVSEFTHNFHSYKHLVVERLMNPHLQVELLWRFYRKKKQNYDRLNRYLTGVLLQITKKYRQLHKESHSQFANVTLLQTDSSIGEKHFYKCIIEEMLCCGATDKEIYDEVGTLLGAGHETVVVAIRMLLLHLALNPEHQTKCRNEADIFFQQKPHGDCKLSMDDLSNLKYLERCILESGRITSTIPIFLRRLDAPLKFDDDLELDAGSNIAILPWVMHKNPKYFPDPEKFDPDRFLPENVKQRHPYAYIPFSGGPRNCIGWKVALMEIKVIMAYILHDFEIFSSDKLEDVKLLFEVTLLPERNYNITLKRRQIY